MATLKDVARRAGISIATASYALNGRVEVSESTRKTVERAARDLNYKPHGIARDLRRNETRTIGLLLSSIAGSFFREDLSRRSCSARTMKWRSVQ